jgi:hypothetical protein
MVYSYLGMLVLGQLSVFLLKIRNQHDVRRFLGLYNYYRKFVKNYSKITNPLNKLLTKDTKFKWTSECQDVFESLKRKLITAPILAFPDMNKPFILTCDADMT